MTIVCTCRYVGGELGDGFPWLSKELTTGMSTPASLMAVRLESNMRMGIHSVQSIDITIYILVVTVHKSSGEVGGIMDVA